LDTAFSGTSFAELLLPFDTLADTVLEGVRATLCADAGTATGNGFAAMGLPCKAAVGFVNGVAWVFAATGWTETTAGFGAGAALTLTVVGDGFADSPAAFTALDNFGAAFSTTVGI